MNRRNTARLTKAGILGEFKRGMQRRLDALKRRPEKNGPSTEEVQESESRWDTLTHQLGD